MKQTKLGHGLTAIVLALFALSGCTKVISEKSSGIASDISTPPAVRPAAPADEPPVSDRPANEKGKVFIAEYHNIGDRKNPFFRTEAEFRGDLERLYKDGFRPCTVSEYLDNHMDLPRGASPVVFTFDDAAPSQIRFLADGSLDPTCAVGIWESFAKTHPGFPVRATFFILPDLWGQPKFRAQKVALVRQLGCELANHTITHPILKRLSDDKVKWELATATDNLEKLGTRPPVPLALPFGVSPKNKSLLRSFDYNGKTYAMKAVLLVGAEPARSPLDPKFDRYRVPRIQAYNGPSSLDEWLGQFERGRVNVYVAP